MKTALIILLTGCCAVCKAQFNTVMPHKSRYDIERIEEQKDKTTIGETKMAAPTAEAVDTASRRQWIEQYLSVAYPLKSIHITSPFGQRTDPFTHKKATHNGLDLQANFTEVYSVMGGQVVKVGSDKRSGNYVTLRYGNYTVSYCHLFKALVKKKQIVAAGEPIAISGNSGRSTGPHLHLTFRDGRKRLNPQILLDYIKIVREEAIRKLQTESMN